MSNFGSSMSVLASGIVVDYWFSSVESFRAYIAKLSVKPYTFQVLESRLCPSGFVLARIVRQHNGNKLIPLPQSDLEV